MSVVKCMHERPANDCEVCFNMAIQYMGDITFSRAISESFGNAREKGFHSIEQTFGDKILLAISELVEAFEEHRNNLDVQTIYFVLDEKSTPKPEGISVEIADCMIRLFDTVGFYLLPIREAYALKTEYNKTREHLHGGKRV